MRSPSSRESLEALPDWSAVPSDSEEDRKLVNQRIAYFGGVVGVLSAAFYVFNIGLGILILACLAKTPAGRPASAAELRAKLEALDSDWTAAEAQQWWQSRAPQVIASSKAGRRQSRSSSPATVAIDLARRSLIQKRSPA